MIFLVLYHNIYTISTFYGEIYFSEPINKNIIKWFQYSPRNVSFSE